MTDLRIDGQQNVPQAQQKSAATIQKGAEQPVAFPKAEPKTTEEKFEASGLAITKEDVKEAQTELGIRTSAKTKERVAQMHNDYAKQILAECGDNAQLRAIAMKYVPELPKASKGGNLQSYKAACDAKLEAFRAAARDAGLGNMLVQHEQNSQDRHVESEVAADNRQGEMQRTTVQVGEAVIGELDAAKEEIVQAVHDDGDKTRKQVIATGNNTVRRVNANTNAKVDEATERGIAANAQNTSAMLGVDAEGYTVTNDDGERVLYNGNAVAYDGSAVGQNLHNLRVLHGVDSDNNPLEDGQGQVTTDGKDFWQNNSTLGRINSARDAVNKHTTEETNRAIKANEAEHKKTRDEVKQVKLDNQRQAVLDAKRQTLSDMLTTEQTESGFGVSTGLFGVGISSGQYRDSTIKWLGSAADRVMGDLDSDFATKKAALDELIRMVDEENVISDKDKKAFEDKYLRHSEKKKVEVEESVDNRQIS